MRFCIKSGIIGLSLAAGVMLSAAHLNAALARDNAQANFQSQQRADQRAFTASPHNGVQQRTFATRQRMERMTFSRASSASGGAGGRQGGNGGNTPPGWSHGKKTGWHGGSMPPGLSRR